MLYSSSSAAYVWKAASESLAQYIATSAWRISSGAVRPCCGKHAMPMLAQMCSATESTSSG